MPRRNDHNLIPLNKRSKEAQREIQEMGRKANAKKWKEKTTVKNIAKMILNGNIPTENTKDLLKAMGLPESELNIQAGIIAGQAMAGIKGNYKAAEFVFSLSGDISTSGILVSSNEKNNQQNDLYIAAKYDLWKYCQLKAPDFYTDDAKYLWEICRALQDIADERDDTELLVINLPPRHGKTRTAGLAVQWYFGNNKNLKIIATSYNEKLSRQTSKSVRNDIMEIKADENRAVFSDIFPGTAIQQGSATADLWRIDGSPTNNYLSTSPKATVTGFGADIIIIDDIVKNAYEANHKGLLDEQFQWFTDTLYSRLEGKAKLIIIMTRWATKDLAGRVISMYEEQGRKIKIISKSAFDGKKMLNERILDAERYQNLIQTVGEDIVRANYDQVPIDLKGRLYGEYITYTEKPEFSGIYAVCDTADEGGDFLCCIIFGLSKGIEPKAYVLDVYYTIENMDITERELCKRLAEYSVDQAMFESNFGGKAFVKVIERMSTESGNKKTLFHAFTQKQNKEARILSNSTNVTRKIYMPEHWNKLFPKFYHDVTEFQRDGKNQHDDGPDCLTMICEKSLRGTVKLIGQK